MNNKPLLSIVVPTKDRYYHLKKLIELIGSFQFDNVELVLQDNTQDNTEILEYLNEKKVSYIKYNHNAPQLPIYYNSDLAILNSSGEYVCFIGDDDGVTRHIIDCVKWMKENDVEVAVPNVISYSWPDAISKKGLNISGKMIYSKFTNEVKQVSAYDQLLNLMEKGFTSRGNLPLVYHGIVKRSTLDKIYEIGDTYFPGPSPDIANGVALSLITNRYFNISMPLIISGASKTHGGGIKKLKHNAGNIEDIPFLPKGAKENWEKNIPLIWTGETVWCESAIKALRYMGREDLIDGVNFEEMYAKFVAFHYPIRSMAYELSKNKTKLSISSWNYIIKRYFNAAKRMVLLRFDKHDVNKEVISNIKDIIEAEKYFGEFLYEFENL